MSAVRDAIQHCMKSAKSYRINEIGDNAYSLVIEIEELPGVSRQVTFEILDASDLRANGMEVPR